MTVPAAPNPPPSGARPTAESGRLRLLVALVSGEGVLMLVAGLAFVVYVLQEGDNTGYASRSDALSGALVLLATMVIWGVGLLLTARAAGQGRRWSFSVILFTQMMWGFIFASSLRGAGGVYLAGVVALLALVVAILALLFHPEVRHRLGRGPAPDPDPR